MNEEIKNDINDWVSRVLKSGINASPEELAILPDMIAYLIV